MLLLRRVVLFALATASVVQAATFSDVLTSLQQADVTTQQILQQCQNYTGASSQFTALAGSVKKHQSQIQQATSNANNSPVPSAAQYQQVLNFLCGQALANLQKALECLKGKKALFVRAGTLSTLCNELKLLRSYFKGLFNAIIAKAPTAALKSQATDCAAKYDAAFASILSVLGCPP